VHLERATAEFVVGVSGDTDLARLLQDASPPARAERPLLNQGRRFVVVTLEDAAAGIPEATASLMEQRRSRPGVWFASPIYCQPVSRVRMVPTDELIVWTNPSTTARCRASGTAIS